MNEGYRLTLLWVIGYTPSWDFWSHLGQKWSAKWLRMHWRFSTILKTSTKSVWSNVFWYVKVCIFWKCISFIIRWDKTQMLKKFPSDKINGTKNALFFSFVSFSTVLLLICDCYLFFFYFNFLKFSMQSWTATTGHGVTRKRSTKRRKPV